MTEKEFIIRYVLERANNMSTKMSKDIEDAKGTVSNLKKEFGENFFDTENYQI